MSKWKPIETAPRDETPIDIWCARVGERLPNYYRVDMGGDNVFYKPVISGRTVVRTASHWMPLPEPPESAQ